MLWIIILIINFAFKRNTSPELSINKNKCSQPLVGDELRSNKNEERRAYMKEYMQKGRADAEFRRQETERDLQRRHDNIETRDKKNRAAKKRRVTNAEQVKEIEKRSKRKQKAKNPEHIREIDKQSFRKRKAKNPGYTKEMKRSVKVRKTDINLVHSTASRTEIQVQKASLPTTDNNKQDWPVASELVPGGMHFHFCLQRAIRSDKRSHGRISGNYFE